MLEESARELAGKGTATALLTLARAGVGLLWTAALAGAGVGLSCIWPRRFASVPEGREAKVGVGRTGLTAGARGRSESESRKGSKAFEEAGCLGRGLRGRDLRLELRMDASWGAGTACGGDG